MMPEVPQSLGGAPTMTVTASNIAFSELEPKGSEGGARTGEPCDGRHLSPPDMIELEHAGLGLAAIRTSRPSQKARHVDEIAAPR